VSEPEQIPSKIAEEERKGEQGETRIAKVSQITCSTPLKFNKNSDYWFSD